MLRIGALINVSDEQSAEFVNASDDLILRQLSASCRLLARSDNSECRSAWSYAFRVNACFDALILRSHNVFLRCFVNLLRTETDGVENDSPVASLAREPNAAEPTAAPLPLTVAAESTPS